jgi:hypothetical protein
MPASFGHMIHGLVARDSADTRISAALSNLLDDALVVRVGGGWRPFSSAGLEIMGGYTMVDLGASATTAEIRGLAGTALPVSIDPLIGPEGIRLNSRLHNVHVTLGWRWVAFDALVIRANLGFTKTLASNSDVQIDQQDAVAATVTNIVSPLLDDAYTRYGNLPTAGLSLGYRF